MIVTYYKGGRMQALTSDRI